MTYIFCDKPISLFNSLVRCRTGTSVYYKWHTLLWQAHLPFQFIRAISHLFKCIAPDVWTLFVPIWFLSDPSNKRTRYPWTPSVSIQSSQYWLTVQIRMASLETKCEVVRANGYNCRITDYDTGTVGMTETSASRLRFGEKLVFKNVWII